MSEGRPNNSVFRNKCLVDINNRMSQPRVVCQRTASTEFYTDAVTALTDVSRHVLANTFTGFLTELQLIGDIRHCAIYQSP